MPIDSASVLAKSSLLTPHLYLPADLVRTFRTGICTPYCQSADEQTINNLKSQEGSVPVERVATT